MTDYKKIKAEYIVTEGIAYPYEEKADTLLASQFGDWVIIAAETPEKAIEKAKIVDAASLTTHVDRFQKIQNIQARLHKLAQQDSEKYAEMTIRELLATSEFRSTFVFSR